MSINSIKNLSFIAVVVGAAVVAFVVCAVTIGGGDKETRRQRDKEIAEVSSSRCLPPSLPSARSATMPVVPTSIRQCQCLTPAAPYPIWGVDSLSGCGCGEVGWD